MSQPIAKRAPTEIVESSALFIYPLKCSFIYYIILFQKAISDKDGIRSRCLAMPLSEWFEYKLCQVKFKLIYIYIGIKQFVRLLSLFDMI